MFVVPNSFVSVRPFISDVENNISQYIRNCPIQSGIPTLEGLHATIVCSKETLFDFVPKPSVVYETKTCGCEQWYSPTLKKRKLVILLDADSLKERREHILTDYRVHDFHQVYVPHIELCSDLPANNSDIRWWINEVANNFKKGGRYYGINIRFAGEALSDTVLDTSDYHPLTVN